MKTKRTIKSPPSKRTKESLPVVNETDCQLKTLSRKDLLTRIHKRDKQLQDNTSKVTLLSGESVSRTFYDFMQENGKPRAIPPACLSKPNYEDNNGPPLD